MPSTATQRKEKSDPVVRMEYDTVPHQKQTGTGVKVKHIQMDTT